MTWQQLSHPNILQYLGVYHLKNCFPRLCLLSPWMDFCQTSILIFPSGRACLGDIYQATNATCRISGKPKWQAPELLINPESEGSPQLNTPATDIHAFGMVCYEVCEFSLTSKGSLNNSTTDVFRRSPIQTIQRPNTYLHPNLGRKTTSSVPHII